MLNRTDLQNKFEEILGTKNVYYQPPESVKLKYPAIIYSRTSLYKLTAGDDTYKVNPSYKVTYVSKTVDDPVIDALLRLPYSRFLNHYAAENLYHDVFEIYT